jgi:HAD superfamily hydrolase (TIGR01509 family)
MVLEALLWDVDGTLAETERDGHRLAFNRAFAEAGVPIHWDPDSYAPWLAVAGGRERIRAALQQLETREPDPGRVETLHARKQVHYAALLAGGGLSLRPGVAALLAAAEAAGLSQAIVTTSGRPAVQALLQQLLPAGADCFRFWVCGDDVSCKKPHPEAYLQAAERLGLPRQRLLVLEDSPAGLAAASAAGLGCVVTRSYYGAREPLEHFACARAVLSGLGAEDRVLRGPACAPGPPTLSYLQTLL